MKLHAALVMFFVVGVAGCSGGEQSSPEPAAEAPMGTSEPAAPAVWQNESFVAHMHEHAEVLDDLNFALADGNLAGAKESAEWLATHDTDSDIQNEWMPRLYLMRSEAEAVVAADDIESAQAAAMRITAQCQECHAAVGINAQ